MRRQTARIGLLAGLVAVQLGACAAGATTTPTGSDLTPAPTATPSSAASVGSPTAAPSVRPEPVGPAGTNPLPSAGDGLVWRRSDEAGVAVACPDAWTYETLLPMMVRCTGTAASVMVSAGDVEHRDTTLESLVTEWREATGFFDAKISGERSVQLDGVPAVELTVESLSSGSSSSGSWIIALHRGMAWVVMSTVGTEASIQEQTDARRTLDSVRFTASNDLSRIFSSQRFALSLELPAGFHHGLAYSALEQGLGWNDTQYLGSDFAYYICFTGPNGMEVAHPSPEIGIESGSVGSHSLADLVGAVKAKLASDPVNYWLLDGIEADDEVVVDGTTARILAYHLAMPGALGATADTSFSRVVLVAVKAGRGYIISLETLAGDEAAQRAMFEQMLPGIHFLADAATAG